MLSVTENVASDASFTPDTTPLTCKQPKPTHTWLVNISGNILSLAYRLCIHYADICLLCLHAELTCTTLSLARVVLMAVEAHRSKAEVPPPLLPPLLLQGSGPLVMEGVSAVQSAAEVPLFDILPHMSAYRRRSVSVFSPPRPAPAGGLYIHRHTCWVRVGGLITGWKKNDRVNQRSCYNWMKRVSAIQCASSPETQRARPDIYLKTFETTVPHEIRELIITARSDLIIPCQTSDRWVEEELSIASVHTLFCTVWEVNKKKKHP